MDISDIENLIKGGETKTLELKKSTGELKDAMHTACAFLNTDGGWLIIGVTPVNLKIIGQDVTDSTRREIASALTSLEPATDIRPESIDIEDLDEDRIRNAVRYGIEVGRINNTAEGEPLEALMGKLNLLKDGQLNVDTIKETHRSFPYNLIIAQVLYLTGYLESWGSGVKRMVDACKAANVPEPEYMATDYEIGITFKRLLGSQGHGGQTGGQTMLDAVFAIIASDPHITRKRLSEVLGINPSAIQKHINRLKDEGRLSRAGGNYGGRWIVNKQDNTK